MITQQATNTSNNAATPSIGPIVTPGETIYVQLPNGDLRPFCVRVSTEPAQEEKKSRYNLSEEGAFNKRLSLHLRACDTGKWANGKLIDVPEQRRNVEALLRYNKHLTFSLKNTLQLFKLGFTTHSAE